VLINLSKDRTMPKTLLKHRVDRVCATYVCVEMSDMEKALNEMAAENLIIMNPDETVKLTEQGDKLGREWRSLLLKKEPIIEVVAGLTDGSITGLVVILSAFIAELTARAAAFAAFLTLAAVAITNFSSFLLGGITEDMADMMTLQNLINYSVGDIPDKKERDKSLMLVKQLFTVLHKEINRSNLFAAIICGTTTFLAGSVPIMAYLLLPKPLDLILSLSIVGAVVGIFLVRYRSTKTKIHWKITLFETVAIVVIAVVASLILGHI
jgi:VIT1/CCC1 family predicted Fe2+/Mn2+ transporter